jgi:HAD superfamily hydrolase (TIGR01484 family)
MRYVALACDFDGTLAYEGRVSESTLRALDRLRTSGRKLILVTGRELEDLLRVFPEVRYFDRAVVENGAVVYDPAKRDAKALAHAPPPAFVQLLRDRGVAPISVGRAIVATWRPLETAVLAAIRDLGLELQVILNKDAVMVLPAGINKASGLATALDQMCLSPHNVVGVGDAENDHAFLSVCECAVAVANALPMLQEEADLITHGARGDGVTELIDALLADDLVALQPRLTRHDIVLGEREDGKPVHVSPHGTNVLVVGPPGAGKSVLVAGLLERLAEHQYQFCVVDPDGDYESLESAIVLGSRQHGPGSEEVVRVISDPAENVVVNLAGVNLADRPATFLAMLPALCELRARTGRPHCLVVHETSHLLPGLWEPALLAAPTFDGVVRIAPAPGLFPRATLESIDVLVAFGDARAAVREWCEIASAPIPSLPPGEMAPGRVLCWLPRSKLDPMSMRVLPGRMVRRHARPFADAELPAERSFYFEGPQRKLHLRAQTLALFVQLADGVDDDTWIHHLRSGDYSRWFCQGVQDESLAVEAAQIEGRRELDPAASRAAIRTAIERRYTLPPAGSARGPHADLPE